MESPIGAALFIEGKADYEIAEDGSSIKIGMRDRDGRAAVLILPPECISALIMTLPGIMQQAMQRRHRDPNAKLVYPLAGWTVERARDDSRLILSLSTPDGFSVSFAASERELKDIGSIVTASTIADRLH
jgi:hypothetical protein